jgi:roadblock/LC7 domain-containing protein
MRELMRGIPAYANGTTKANHGSMFVAGESGSELVGHINGRTEVLNRFQLGAVMHSSIVDGMSQFLSYVTDIENKMAQCTNAIISANLVNADMLYSGVTASQSYNTEEVAAWMNSVGDYTGSGVYGDGATDQIADGVRAGMYDATARQNDLLREQNDLLRRILEKDTTVEVTTNSFTKAINRKNQRDGKTVIPVSV